MINKTNRKRVKENNTKRIFFLYFSKNNNRANRIVLSPTKANPISGSTPPYSLKMLFPDNIYSRMDTNTPKIIYPNGFLYFVLEIKIRYNHNKEPISIKTKRSFKI